ncbi:FGGY-family carbohydrate kinase (plasmid) [Rhizobium leguminosarum bv. viciae 248]|uniref:FGGY-family carbohydrate kinase n=1 Tax=Rhizobium leguminosarum TaxID=384 RepID=UPI000368A8BA|nr:FGGY-family carbohydrate kinase [Rhizobium leguminosarum]MCA2409575.1 FGGY-family carbohydrate kinase [Rhizobium leguminosarum]NKM62310.1 carbohydrate kinase [Rhizobium leguminosarum bv. viciae]QHW29027.1 FGGY-family carbohydrate kinase [Rhizobium leguminosarum bv. viciae 248]
MSITLGLDIGTTSTIGILIELPNRVLGLTSRPSTLHSPQHGWAEEDPAEWWANVCEITRELIATTGIEAGQISAVGVTGMLPAVVLLDDAGYVLRPSIQQSDGRCGEEVEELKAEWDEADFLAKAGNGINQQLVTAKLRWIARHEPTVFERIATVMGSYDFINWKLTGEKAIEQNWALEAGFVDINTDRLDDELIGLARVRRDAIPRKAASHEVLGHLTNEAAKATGLAPGTPVIGGAADMIASAFGAGINKAGDVLLKFGGAVDILTATDVVRPDRRMFLDYHLVPGLYMPNGCMSTGGSGLNWFISTFAGREQIAAKAEGISVHHYLDRLAAACAPGADGLTILPYFLGEKTPIHDAGARGLIDGLTLSHHIGHLWRAMLEAYAYALRHHIDVLNDIGHPTTRFIVSDGGSQSRIWMQIVSDVLQQPLQGLTGHPGSCLGVAWAAAIGAGLTKDWSGVTAFVGQGDRIVPDADNAAVYDRGYRTYRALYRP